MRFHIVTIFPDFFSGPFEYGVVCRAKQAGILRIQIHDLRNWTYDRHRTVDDRPFGGGEGMLLKPEPLFQAVEQIFPERSPGHFEPRTKGPERPVRSDDPRTTGPERPVRSNETRTTGPERPVRSNVILLSAQGRRFDQAMARRYSELDELLLICGRYEGIDERVVEHLADEEVSVGDFVLSGGELAAAIVVDTVARLLPGVLGNEDSSKNESFAEENEGLLDCPQYTRPAEFRGLKVPDVLLGGNHEEIRRWRRAASREKTGRLRPDLIGGGS